jgi:hypothetical protein
MDKKGTKNNRDKIFIITILVLAGIRVFVFSAAFPICNNVDESSHLDMVHKYARGYIPTKGIELFDRQTLELIVLNLSPEYLYPDEPANERNQLPPLWKHPHIKETKEFQDYLSQYEQEINHETGSFPVYYLWAGLWWNCDKLIGVNDVNLPYLIRFLNIPVFIAMVWVAYLTGKLLFPDNDLMQKGLAVMAAFFPQDVFYSISNDTISPLLFSLSFFMLMKILFGNKSLGFYFLTAFVIAIALLNKITNITMLALLAPIIIFKARQTIIDKNFKENIFRLLALIIVSITPVILWMIRNHFVLGDITGSAAKNDYLGWKIKPLGQMLHHPIFSLNGAAFFLGELIKTFWRGEFVWHLKIISSKITDSFYLISTAVFVLVSLISLFRNKNKQERTIFETGFILIAASVMMLAVSSILYDYGKCMYPSPEHPYFTSGRLILTALAPFLIIYLDGLEKVLKMLRLRFNPLILVVIIAIAITLSEIILSWPVFASPYNWFHLI